MVTAPSFSVVVIARNEAHTLPVLARSLDGFLSAGGELLVVDTGSDDETIRVAREVGARVETAGGRFHSVLTEAQAADITKTFSRGKDGPLVEAGQVLFDFGAAREFASGLASHDFVWHIDASDEILSADFDFLESMVRTEGVSGFEYSLGLGGSRFRIGRFFDRRLFSWHGRVHEAPYDRTNERKGRHVICDERQLLVRHTRHEKARNYTAGLALDVMAHPAAPRPAHYLGRELHYAGLYRSALAVLRRRARMKGGSVPERGETVRLIGSCLEALGRADEAADNYLRAFLIDPSRRQALVRLAVLQQDQSNFQASVAFASAALMAPRANPYMDAEESPVSDPHAVLYWGLFWLGRREEARQHWEICREADPDNERFREHGRLFQTTATPPP